LTAAGPGVVEHRHESASVDTVIRVSNMSIIERAGQVLASAARSPARVILFGSGARGEDDAGSDLDFLVIERSVDDRIARS